MPTNPNPNRRKNIKPGLSVPADLNHPELEKFLQGVKEALQGADGTRGQPLERFVTLQDLKDAGLINTGVKNGRGIITEVLHPEEDEESSSGSGDGDFSSTGARDGDVLEFNDSNGRWEPYELLDVSSDPLIVRRDRLPEEVAYQDEDETITGTWTFTMPVTIIPEVVGVDSQAFLITRTGQDVGVPPGGFEIKILDAVSPGDDTGYQMGMWESSAGGDYDTFPPDNSGSGYRWRMAGDENSAADLIFYSHSGSAAGAEIYRHHRDAANMVFVGGSAGAPTITFNGDEDTGIWQTAAGQLNFTVNGTNRVTFTTTVLSTSLQHQAAGGSAGAPAYSFNSGSDTDTGMYRVGANSLGFSCGGTVCYTQSTTLALFSTALTAGGVINVPDGAVGAPSFSFTNDTDTGLYLSGTNALSFAAGGTLRLTVDTSAITATLAWLGADGSAGSPSSSFSADTNTGFYRVAADTIGVATNGTEKYRINSSGAIGIGGANYGTAGQVFTSNGSAASPTWEDAATGGGGSLVYVNTTVPAGNTVANVTTETGFASEYEIPADTLIQGSAIRVHLAGVYSTDATVAPEIVLRIKVDSTTIIETPAITLGTGVANQGWTLDAFFVVQTAGATGTLERQGVVQLNGTVIDIPTTSTATIDTTTPLTVKAFADWTAADADDTITLREMGVWVEQITAAAAVAADAVTYDNTASGLTATDVQAAIDELAEGAGNDPYILATTFLCSFDGADAATAASDDSRLVQTITFVGTAQLDTAQQKFGSASLLLDGNSDYVTVPDRAEHTVVGQFTVEAWIRINALGANDQVIASQYNASGSNRTWTFHVAADGTAVHFQVSNTGASVTHTASATGLSLATGIWYHVAATRGPGGTLRVFVDGTVGGTTDTVTGPLADSATVVAIGTRFLSGSPNLYFNGWIDEVRITNGFARYTANFTPATAAFPRS